MCGTWYALTCLARTRHGGDAVRLRPRLPLRSRSRLARPSALSRCFRRFIIYTFDQRRAGSHRVSRAARTEKKAARPFTTSYRTRMG